MQTSKNVIGANSDS